MATSIGLFDPEVKYDALFDDTNVDLGWFDRELVDSSKLGISQFNAIATFASEANPQQINFNYNLFDSFIVGIN